MISGTVALLHAALECAERLELVGSGVPFDEYMRIVGLDDWSAIERHFDVERADE